MNKKDEDTRLLRTFSNKKRTKRLSTHQSAVFYAEALSFSSVVHAYASQKESNLRKQLFSVAVLHLVGHSQGRERGAACTITPTISHFHAVRSRGSLCLFGH